MWTSTSQASKNSSLPHRMGSHSLANPSTTSCTHGLSLHLRPMLLQPAVEAKDNDSMKVQSSMTKVYLLCHKIWWNPPNTSPSNARRRTSGIYVMLIHPQLRYASFRISIQNMIQLAASSASVPNNHENRSDWPSQRQQEKRRDFIPISVDPFQSPRASQYMSSCSSTSSLTGAGSLQLPTSHQQPCKRSFTNSSSKSRLKQISRSNIYALMVVESIKAS